MLSGLFALLLAAGTASAAPARLLIFGEQHDQPDQQRQVADAVQALAARGELAAVVLEMAERPHAAARPAARCQRGSRCATRCNGAAGPGSAMRRW